MGFQRGNLILKFNDPELADLEIKMRRLPIGDLMGVSKLAEMGEELKEQLESLDSLLEITVANIISWNLEDEEFNPVPVEKGKPSYWDEQGNYHPSTGFYLLDFNLVLSIVNTWIEQAAGVTEDMGKASKNGKMKNTLPQEEFALMQITQLAENPDSLVEQN